MKNKMLWIGSVIILVLSVICFVVFGVGTEIIRAVTGDTNGVSFGKYNGKDIVLAPGTDFANAVQNYQNYYQNMGQQLDQSAYFYIYNYAFNAAIQSEAYKDAVKKSGYKPSAKAVSQQMLGYFLNSDGKYDPKLYSQVPQADREKLKTDIAKQLVWQRFSDDTFGSSEKLGDYTFYGLKSTSKENDFLASLNTEKRSISVVSFDKSAYPTEEIKAFGKDNISLFNSYSLSVLTVKDEAQAKKLLAQINGNEITFEDAITEYSEKYYSDGDGKVKENYEYQITGNLANKDDLSKISGLAKDALSEIIKNTNGYSIYKCTGDKTAANLDDQATVDAVKNYITTNKAEMIDSYFTEKAKVFAASAKLDGFEKAASNAGVEVSKVSAFPLNYGDTSIADKMDVSSVKGLASASTNEDFLKTIFSMKLNDISEPTTIGNYINVIQLTGIQKEEAKVAAEASSENGEEKEDKIASEIQNYDQTGAQSALLSSSKVENNVADTYFNKILAK